jgi:hypothetical protein
VTVTLPGAPTEYPPPAPSETTTVSSGSTAVSSIGATMIAAEAAPAGIVTLPVKAV